MLHWELSHEKNTSKNLIVDLLFLSNFLYQLEFITIYHNNDSAYFLKKKKKKGEKWGLNLMLYSLLSSIALQRLKN
jgi:hypothetical protein